MATSTAPTAGAALARTLGDVWPLLAGIGLLMLGNGLQGSLLGLRATAEGFGPTAIGLITASFFSGFLLGAVWTVRAVRRVGHIRVFAALASVASVSILLHGMVVEPFAWGALRFVTGVCFAGVMVVAESWLNNSARNDARGQLLALYMITSFAGFGGGQFLLNLAQPGAIDLFILVSILISLAAVPILLTVAATPSPDAPAAVGLARLYRVSPLGVAAAFAAGLVNGAVFGMGPVFAASVGYDVATVALFMGAIIAGAALLQWPIGKLSDVMDRRRVLTATTFAAAAIGLALALTRPDAPWFLAGVALFGGLSLSLHSLALSHTNDHLEPTEIVGASSALVLILGAGSIVAPPAIGAGLSAVGSEVFFLFLAGVHGAVGAFALYRMSVREAPPAEAQGPYMAMPSAPSPVAVAAAEEAHAEQVGS